MKKIVMTMLVVGLVAFAAQAATVQFTLNETAPGTWEMLVDVGGTDTAGLSAYGMFVNIPTAQVSYTENLLFDIGSFSGMFPNTAVNGDVGGIFNAGNFQNSGGFAIQGMGMVPIALGSVNLGVPALLGTFTTPVGLGAADFTAEKAGLLNVNNDGFLIDLTLLDTVVNPVPEPMTLSLIGIGGLALIRRRK